ncbi:MAG: hypothetical protein JWQ32_89, partial [Marmoricola sp.]|nr:hypothetical protein [Marmoricola sp.]
MTRLQYGFVGVGLGAGVVGFDVGLAVGLVAVGDGLLVGLGAGFFGVAVALFTTRTGVGDAVGASTLADTGPDEGDGVVAESLGVADGEAPASVEELRCWWAALGGVVAPLPWLDAATAIAATAMTAAAVTPAIIATGLRRRPASSSGSTAGVSVVSSWASQGSVADGSSAKRGNAMTGAATTGGVARGTSTGATTVARATSAGSTRAVIATLLKASSWNASVHQAQLLMCTQSA